MSGLELIRVLRRLRRSWRFSLAIIASVGIGVGPIVVATSFCEATFLRDVNVRQGLGDLAFVRAAIGSNAAAIPRGVSYPDYQDLRAAVPGALLNYVTAWTIVDVNRASPNGDEPLRLAAVSGDYFRIGNARFVQGYPPSDEGTGVVVRRALWRRLSSEGDASHVKIYGRQYAVTGVVDDAFRGMYSEDGVDGWIPLTELPLIDGDSKLLSFRELENLSVLIATRSRGGVPSLLGPIGAISRHLADYHEGNLGWHLETTSATPTFVQLLRTRQGESAFASLLVLLCVLLIAATNTADLFVIRTAAREVECQLRLALGLPRAQLILYECLEPLILGLACLAVGLWLGISALHYLAPVPALERLGLQVSSVAIVAACAAALVFAGICALFPAMAVSRAREAAVTHVGQGITSHRIVRVQRAYLVVQFTFALGFTYVAALLAAAVHQQGAVDLGFDTKRLLVVRGARGADGRKPVEWGNDYNRVVAAVSSIHGVVSVSGSVSEFFGGFRPPVRDISLVRTAGRKTPLQAEMHVIGRRYFATLGLPVLAGREFGEQDNFGPPKNILVNQTLARLVAQDGEPLGKTIYELGTDVRYIVGVVPDIRATAAERVRPAYYRSFSETPLPIFVLYVRVATPSPAYRSAIFDAILRQLPESEGRLEIHTAEEYRRQRDLPAIAMFWLSFGLASLTVLIAGLGLYSVASYSVASREREHGIRAALGASPLQLAGLVVRDGLKLTVVATVLSMPAIWVGLRLVQSLVVGAHPMALIATTAVVGTYAIVMMVSLAVPAARIASLSPAEAFRSL